MVAETNAIDAFVAVTDGGDTVAPEDPDGEDKEIEAIAQSPPNAFITSVNAFIWLGTTLTKFSFCAFLNKEPMPAIVTIYRNGKTVQCSSHGYSCRHVHAVNAEYDLTSATRADGEAAIGKPAMLSKSKRSLSFRPIPFRLPWPLPGVPLEKIPHELHVEVPTDVSKALHFVGCVSSLTLALTVSYFRNFIRLILSRIYVSQCSAHVRLILHRAVVGMCASLVLHRGPQSTHLSVDSSVNLPYSTHVAPSQVL